MSDYFSEYSSFVGNKGLPTPTDTPYEIPAFTRSKRNSRATTIGTHSREQSHSPPPLPPDPSEHQDKGRDGRYAALDPRRFTPTLHASLVAEILSLRRELDSKNHLVENLETGLAAVKNDNEQLNEQLASSAKDVRIARAQIQQMENGTHEAFESVAVERDAAQTLTSELRLKLDVAQKKIKLQDDDAERTQTIWEREKDSWENERRQLERRVHVTETRLRTFVDEMISSQTRPRKLDIAEDESRFQDSGLGADESDSESAGVPITTHRRQISNTSYASKFSAPEQLVAPEPNTNGFSLADELDDEDEYDGNEFDNDDEDELDYHEAVRQTIDSRQSFRDGEMESKAKRVLGLTDEVPSSPVRTHSRFGSRDNIKVPVLESPLHRWTPSEQSSTSESPKRSEYEPRPLSIVPEVPGEVLVESKSSSTYVDTGYQPSPPPSPSQSRELAQTSSLNTATEQAPLPAAHLVQTPAIVPAVPIEASAVGSDESKVSRPSAQSTDSSTQTEGLADPARILAPKRDSLQLPVLVPQIAIHPPTSRPTTPRKYALPPGTKNVSTQAAFLWSGVDASMQTEEIRIDKRPVKLPPHLLPSYVLDHVPDAGLPRRARDEGPGTARILETTVLNARPSVEQTEVPSSGLALSRDNSSKDLRAPLKVIPLPKPTLAPAFMEDRPEPKSQGPLNRSTQFGVSHEKHISRLLADIEHEPETDDENPAIARAMSAAHRPNGRFIASEHPRDLPEDKELSPERRPLTTESTEAAPAPSVSSSREGKEHLHRPRKRPPPKLNTYSNLRDRSPSLGSYESSSWSAQAGVAIPPYPIPTRSSSRQLPPFSYSEGDRSPSAIDPFVVQASKTAAARRQDLRKVQSTASIRHERSRASPRKSRRRVRSPELTPVQSMAFESPAPGTAFPIPELPTPLAQGPSSDYQWGSRSTRAAHTSISSMPYGDETGLVDAIAATMVGEWMWKYIRKRKSFGVGESTDDFATAGHDGVLDIPGIGTRHKRWVWLSPYEKTIMWDSKQPMNGTALLGKKGRKLIIQSVLDVQDDTILPKKPELESVHDRSILILTPVRALKFTCTTAERHHFWMTALTFLAESNRMDTTLPPLPLVPPMPSMPARAPPLPPAAAASHAKASSPAFGRSTVRDSVRLAKNKAPESQPEEEGADFPAVPRLYSSTSKHQRKRSNTSPRLPPALNTLRSFSSTAVSTNSSQAYIRPIGSAGKVNTSTYSSSRGNSVAGADAPFFETTGTVRMEAFVDPNIKDGVLYVPAPPSQNAQNRGRRRGDSNLSLTGEKRRGAYAIEDEVDPFRGF